MRSAMQRRLVLYASACQWTSDDKTQEQAAIYDAFTLSPPATADCR
jgi:hypothetical protein